jgi:hypothetical protein
MVFFWLVLLTFLIGLINCLFTCCLYIGINFIFFLCLLKINWLLSCCLAVVDLMDWKLGSLGLIYDLLRILVF